MCCCMPCEMRGCGTVCRKGGADFASRGGNPRVHIAKQPP